MIAVPLLDAIHSPADLRRLSIEEMRALAEEIRALIIEVVARNGGHLSSNLGAVELTLALHREFEAPRDRIIWDIGHQCYTHKIVTGRRPRMGTIRTRGGLLGFPDRDESEYDVVNTGHASTSLGFAAGLAMARDRAGSDGHIVAVVGDGALTGGVALEALNHIGQLRPPLIIVLNDNKMSISPNVGAISKHLNYLALGRPYIRFKEVLHRILTAIPLVGRGLFQLARKVEILARTMMVPGSLFDELGIKYIGPINGHDLRELLKEFREAKAYDVPVLLHVVTRKGRGYEPAADNPSSFHSSSPFNISNGQFLKKEAHVSYSEVFGRTAARLVALDPQTVALTAAMPEGTGLDAVQRQFPEHFFDVGIAEQYMFDFAGGLALAGRRPVVGVYSTFLQRALDQVIHDISLMNLPVLVGLDRAGLVGGDGPTHQGLYDIAMLRPVPNLLLLAPRDENELQHMLYTAFRQKKPAFVRFPKEPARGTPLDGELRELPVGRAEVMRPGSAATILAVGPLVWRALQAAERLHRRLGLDIEVVDVRWIKPLDEELLKARAAAARPLVTVEDGALAGGFGTMVRERIDALGFPGVRLLRIGVAEEVVPLASRAELLARYGLDAEGIERQVGEFLVPPPFRPVPASP